MGEKAHQAWEISNEIRKLKQRYHELALEDEEVLHWECCGMKHHPQDKHEKPAPDTSVWLTPASN